LERTFGMQLKIKARVDFGKLALTMPSLIDNYLTRVAVSSSGRAKEAIDSGNFTPLAQSTREIREKGQSPASGRTKTSSAKPLVHTGSLRKSIKAKGKSMEMLSYGIHHLTSGKTANSRFAKAFNMSGKNRPARDFLSLSMKLGSKDATKLTKNFFKAIRKALHKKTPLK